MDVGVNMNFIELGEPDPHGMEIAGYLGVEGDISVDGVSLIKRIEEMEEKLIAVKDAYDDLADKYLDIYYSPGMPGSILAEAC